MRFPSIVGLAAIVSLAGFASAREVPADTSDFAKRDTQQVAGSALPGDGMQDINDLLWLLGSDRKKLGSPYQQILDGLENCKVPTVAKAEAEAIRFKMASGGILAEEGVAVVGLLRIGVELPTFAKSGDLVWVVRFSHQFRGVTQEMWISSTTGAVRNMLPMQELK